jgi:methylphosphotriester-DNA--protein-cysteine methyltransferase
MLAKLPSHEEIYGALCRKDQSLVGIVFIAVRTTGHLLPAWVPRAHAVEPQC